MGRTSSEVLILTLAVLACPLGCGKLRALVLAAKHYAANFCLEAGRYH